MRELRGRVTLILTPELRALAVAQVAADLPSPEAEELRELLTSDWFPDGGVVDAARSASEALIIQCVAAAILSKYE